MQKLICVLLGIYIISCVYAQPGLKLWYKQPAVKWTEALPLGNGHLGAMVFGRTNDELIQLNEATLWSGGPVKTNVNPEAKNYLPQIREALLKNEDYDKAIELAKKMQGLFTESYLPMADLEIKQQFKDSAVSAYYRDLDISNAISTTKFTIDGVDFTRKIFISAPDKVMVIKLSASKQTLNAVINIKSLLHFKNNFINNDELVLNGKAPAHVDPSYYNVHKEPVEYNDTNGCNGMRFEVRLKASSKDGKIFTDTAGIHITNASEAVIILSAATSFNGFDKCPDKDGKDENLIAQQYLNNAEKKTFDDLLKNHIQSYQHYFNRVSFVLNDTVNSDNNMLPSDKRLQAYSSGKYDPGIETQYFQYGRYLLISSSAPDGVPANLQGIWNNELRAPWSSNYTININTEMNYWPAEETNLTETAQPLFMLIKNLAVTGSITAKEFYGMNGWVAHHNTDIWALSNPVGDKGWGDPRWANWTQGGNWLCLNLYEHFRFTNDTAFLKDTAYPLMKGAAQFCINWLVEDSNGYLVTAPSVSPENVFSYAKNKQSDVSVATTMDMSIIRNLFSNLIEASTILNTDKNFRDSLIEKRNKLYPYHIGKKGNLQEWNKDWDDVEVHHRHVSHLFGLYPGNDISPLTTPALADAAKKSLQIRGDESTGWSLGWKINLWARLLDGNHAYSLLKLLLHATADSGYNYENGGGTYPNFFDAHPPFQIDGNFGGIAGITEMLLQSQLNELFLLPALPDAWKSGAIKGLKARGNFEVAIEWNNHQLTMATIHALSGGICKVRCTTPFKIEGAHTNAVKDNYGYVVSFNTIKGNVYKVAAL